MKLNRNCFASFSSAHALFRFLVIKFFVLPPRELKRNKKNIILLLPVHLKFLFPFYFRFTIFLASISKVLKTTFVILLFLLYFVFTSPVFLHFAFFHFCFASDLDCFASIQNKQNKYFFRFEANNFCFHFTHFALETITNCAP